VFQAMLGQVIDRLPGGQAIESEAFACPYGEGDIGDPLRALAKDHSGVTIGSYPKFDGNTYSTEIVIRSRDRAALAAASEAVRTMLEAMGPSG